MMPEKFIADDLLSLKRDIDEFLVALDNKEYTYCEGDDSYQNCCDCAERAEARLKSRLRGVVIDCGLYGEILQDFINSCKQNGLVLTSTNS
jgi:hypothetical protein